ncbi:MAG: hypothetical protein KTR33_08190 [Gammaproteobacteria bacterium]|nr:hypothetical protein [Gammaproteobacteria bacterium]
MNKLEDFFVGYLPFPAGLKPFYRLVVVAGLLLAVAGGIALASLQKSPSHSQWDTGAPMTVEGVLTMDPYPILHRADVPDGEAMSVMLVQTGKFSADMAAEPYAGKRVSIDGFGIRRGGWLMLEISGADAIQAVPESTDFVALPAITPLGEVTLSGEVMDTKCFLGVMNPGSGQAHKACAELCLLGGIPPMLAVKDAENRKFGYLLKTASGESASLLVAEVAAESVEISGQLERQGDMLYLRIADDQVVRR